MKKIVLLGDSGVGKSSLVRRFVIDAFDDKYIATIGTKVLKKDLQYKLPAKTIFLTMQIWDILGQREFRKIRSVGTKGTNGVILVADLTNQESILGIVEFWYPQVQKTEGDVPAVVVGNKCDLIQPDDPSKQRLISIAGEISAPYFFCSARTGLNVENAFRALGEIVIGGSKDIRIPEDDANASISTALDSIITDFCDQFDDTTKSMEAVEKLSAKAELNINSPTRECSLEAIELMAEYEKDRLGKEIAEVNKLRRWKILEEATGPK